MGVIDECAELRSVKVTRLHQHSQLLNRSQEEVLGWNTLQLSYQWLNLKITD
jgi:hypothetical protein